MLLLLLLLLLYHSNVFESSFHSIIHTQLLKYSLVHFPSFVVIVIIIIISIFIIIIIIMIIIVVVIVIIIIIISIFIIIIIIMIIIVIIRSYKNTLLIINMFTIIKQCLLTLFNIIICSNCC